MALRVSVSRSALIAGALGCGLGLVAAPVWAAEAPAASASSDPTPAPSEVIVTARRLSAARASIQPQIGASTYTIDSKAIAALPGGDNVSMNQVVLQAPGVAQDSYGQLHIRGEHNGLQFRLNGVILPEGLSVFSQALSPKLADKVQLITGALPAEYGLRTAGIVDITSKTIFDNSGSATIYGGSHGEYQPSFDYGGNSGNVNYFVSLGYLHNNLGIESPDGRANPLHDTTDQFQGFGYVEDTISPDSRVSLIVGSSVQRFQIPNQTGDVAPFTLANGQTLDINGAASYPNQQLNENQRELTHYVIASFLHNTDQFTSQVSLFARYSRLSFSPDQVGDLYYDGIAQTADKTDTAGGLQAEGVYHLSDAHTLRGGVIIEIDRSTSLTNSLVLPLTEDGAQASTTPLGITDSGARTAETYSAYVQDEWKLAPGLTLNYGLRYDDFEAYRDQSQWSPRANLVWLPLDHTTIHIGYARYFTPPPFELVGGETISKFVGTTAAANEGLDTTPYAERANYYDVGAEQTVLPGLTVGIDTYYKTSSNLIDEGQFGAPIIETPFNYKNGVQYGIEWSSAYQHGPFSSYLNVAFEHAQGQDIDSSEFNFSAADLAYIKTHYIYLDHDQRFSGSAGVSYLWKGTRMSADLIYGSGLRGSGSLIPNGRELAPYTQVNLGLSHRFQKAAFGPYEVRLDVTNLFDDRYEIRDGTGVGVGAPQYGARRGIFGGVTKEF